MDTKIWIVAYRHRDSAEWVACGFARSAAAAHDRQIVLREMASLLGSPPAAWRTIPSGEIQRIATCLCLPEALWDRLQVEAIIPAGPRRA